MRSDSKIFEDIARMAGGAVHIVSGLKQQVREDVRSRMDDMAANMNLVPREDFDHVCAVISDLTERIGELEARLDALTGKKSGGKTRAAKTKKSKTTKAAKKKK